MTPFNSRIRQVLLISVILLLGYLIARELYVFLPGFLGAVTLYILSRDRFTHLVNDRKWRPGWTAVLFMLVALVLIGLPLYYAIQLVVPKVNAALGHTEELMTGLKAFAEKISAVTGQDILTDQNIKDFQQKAAGFLPTFLNSSLNILANIAVMFFTYYYMATSSREMESMITQLIPLHQQSIDQLSAETKTMVRANALGIPLISLIQGVTAMLGYWIFGLKDWAMWGFLTGVFAFFPIVGTMIIWTPLVIYMYSQGMNWQATGLMIYSFVVTGNVDYLARVTLMKKMGNIHPLVTVFGVIVGLNLFGFMGFIFGPLLFSYLILLVRIYATEFSHDHGRQHPG
jgi:predicted PurR-regulated permease PerM